MRMVESLKHEDTPMGRIQLSLKEIQPVHTAVEPTRPDRVRRETYGGTGFAAFALAGIVAWCQPAAAAVCRVPAAVLCEGCAEKLSIRIAHGGACRISFTPATPPEQAGSAKFVDITIETETPRPTMHRVSMPHLSIVRHAAPLRACFVFNGRRFCE